MSEAIIDNDPVYSLNKAFLLNFPGDAARRLETLQVPDAVGVLLDQPVHLVANVIERLSPGIAETFLDNMPDEFSVKLLSTMDTGLCTTLLSRLNESRRRHYLDLMNESVAQELESLLEYPDNTAGRLMQTHIIAFNENFTVERALDQIKHKEMDSLHHLFLLDDNMRLHGQVDIQRIALAEGSEKLAALALPVTVYVNAMDHKDDVVEKLEKYRVDVIPVVDGDHRLVGVIEGQGLIDVLREDFAADMQTMVGASKDERALSSSLFAVRKRLPWLQINLLTAFLAAAVVGLFEDTIAKFTALAILLPVAAGQSGNAGAQALAVTMRGLTLREITMRHWLKVMIKEFGTGLMNGLGIALTCSAGVYVWSQNIGLSLVMALAMIISMTIASVAGAVVPILLKRFGLDPAQSSSIVLTTITDIAGFLSFLGIATALASLLES
ncbi:magnesium transporter [Emcibacter sp.]|uniref:magnesium transporter n=1 Tax=Emcibacter sp. TaxID=1979954 RepID=UPI003A8E15C6